MVQSPVLPYPPLWWSARASFGLTPQKRGIGHNLGAVEVIGRGAWDVAVVENTGGYYLDDIDAAWKGLRIGIADRPMFFDRERGAILLPEL